MVTPHSASCYARALLLTLESSQPLLYKFAVFVTLMAVSCFEEGYSAESTHVQALTLQKHACKVRRETPTRHHETTPALLSLYKHLIDMVEDYLYLKNLQK